MVGVVDVGGFVDFFWDCVEEFVYEVGVYVECFV